MEALSVVHMFKIGVGPSSSHTLGPWQAVRRFIGSLGQDGSALSAVRVELYGSLAKTGRGHGTDVALMMGLTGADPETVDVDLIPRTIADIREHRRIEVDGRWPVVFDPEADIRFLADELLPGHPNGLRIEARLDSGETITDIYYSVGGGFVLREGESDALDPPKQPLPCPVESAADLTHWCAERGLPISAVVMLNEQAWRPEAETRRQVLRVRDAMQACIFRGCHEEGELPGGLHVVRRAARLNRRLLGSARYGSHREWLEAIRASKADFASMLDWVSCFALAVNEENAAFGRVVTAPTNGAAGVIPAVLQHLLVSRRMDEEETAIRFLLVASEIGCIFKKRATISAAMGGCQAEIGVSSAMAAAGLTECLGGSVAQCLMAAEIAMEHHLGMTCDPVGGLVQVPCIERNTMGAVKAITASRLALCSDPAQARVSLDAVVKTMWETAQDMNTRYKETSDGGLAVNIPISLSEC